MTDSFPKVRIGCLPLSRPIRLLCDLPIRRLPLPYVHPLLLALLLIGCNEVSAGVGANAPASSSRLLIASSPALLPLVRAAAVLFERQHPEAQITVQSSESPDGISALEHRQADIAATSLYADPSASSAANLLDQPFCVVPFLIIVHPDVTLASLSPEQILSIFSTGAITNWKQIGGPDRQVVVVVPPLTSDIRLLFREEVLGSAAEVGNVLPIDSLETLRETVARTPGGIGYLPAPLLNDRVREVAFGGEPATSDAIVSGRYPFWSFAHLYIRDVPADEEMSGDTKVRAAFLPFMRTAAVEQLVRQLGYIPLPDMKFLPVSLFSVAGASLSTTSA